jgi:hypothetical protein
MAHRANTLKRLCRFVMPNMPQIVHDASRGAMTYIPKAMITTNAITIPTT